MIGYEIPSRLGQEVLLLGALVVEDRGSVT